MWKNYIVHTNVKNICTHMCSIYLLHVKCGKFSPQYSSECTDVHVTARWTSRVSKISLHLLKPLSSYEKITKQIISLHDIWNANDQRHKETLGNSQHFSKSYVLHLYRGLFFNSRRLRRRKRLSSTLMIDSCLEHNSWIRLTSPTYISSTAEWTACWRN